MDDDDGDDEEEGGGYGGNVGGPYRSYKFPVDDSSISVPMSYFCFWFHICGECQ